MTTTVEQNDGYSFAGRTNWLWRQRSSSEWRSLVRLQCCSSLQFQQAPAKAPHKLTVLVPAESAHAAQCGGAAMLPWLQHIHPLHMIQSPPFSLATALSDVNRRPVLTPEAGSNKCKASSPVVHVAGLSHVGQYMGTAKRVNQDGALAIQHFRSEGSWLFAVFDGHGEDGHVATHVLKSCLPHYLLQHMEAHRDLQTALKGAVLALDGALRRSGVDFGESGAAAVVAVLQGRQLAVAGVGDCRVVLGRERSGDKGLEAVQLTRDHKVDDLDEQQRILDAGGRVGRLQGISGPDGPMRVFMEDGEQCGLALSRALGDFHGRKAGVIPTPETTKIKLKNSDKVLVLASDGIWDYMENGPVVNLVGQDEMGVKHSCRTLVATALERNLQEQPYYADDMTCLVARLSWD